jgi:hypothetical protein
MTKTGCFGGYTGQKDTVFSDLFGYQNGHFGPLEGPDSGGLSERPFSRNLAFRPGFRPYPQKGAQKGVKKRVILDPLWRRPPGGQIWYLVLEDLGGHFGAILGPFLRGPFPEISHSGLVLGRTLKKGLKKGVKKCPQKGSQKGTRP